MRRSFHVIVALFILLPLVGCNEDPPSSRFSDTSEGSTDASGDVGPSGDTSGDTGAYLDTGADTGPMVECTSGDDCDSGVCDTDSGQCAEASCEDGVQNQDETDVDCGGDTCEACADTKSCAEADDCASGVCEQGSCAAPDCEDGVENGDETDVDCGGSQCEGCENQQLCMEDGDCKSGVCLTGEGGNGGNGGGEAPFCVAATCDDGVKNGQESDVDCGGADSGCAGCEAMKACSTKDDCKSGVCENGQCQAPACDDGVRNGQETGTDCGGAGSGCAACAAGEGCQAAEDCVSKVCDEMSNTCVAAACDDGVKNGTETGLDCGGMCGGCDPGASCNVTGDCKSGVCKGGACAAPTCSDGVSNGDETGTDCGGPNCGACPAGQSCGADGDCTSSICQMGTCVMATCMDGVKNGQESDVDCGGPVCNACADGKSCDDGGDCVSLVCKGGTCAAPTCNDLKQNGQETDTDCGGAGSGCPTCRSGGSCQADGDCQSGVCTNNICQKPTCSDQVQNGRESDVDCGGNTCNGCNAGESCGTAGDCASKVCSNGSCAAPTCSDGVKNGQETDVDCGGPQCTACAAGESCSTNGDCASGLCSMGTCAPEVNVIGNLTAGNPGRWDDGSFAPSCQAYRYPSAANYSYKGVTGDGYYKIKPHSNKAAFAVYCDQTTRGGGWTAVDTSGVAGKFGDTMSAPDGGTCKLFGTRPGSQETTTNHSCRYDVDLGFQADTIRLSKVRITAVTGATSDLVQVKQDWGQAWCTNSKPRDAGDIWFGTPADKRWSISAGQEVTNYDCNSSSKKQYANGQGFTLDGVEATTSKDTTLRIEWGERGPQVEAWRWDSGRIFVRDSSSIP